MWGYNCIAASRLGFHFGAIIAASRLGMTRSFSGLFPEVHAVGGADLAGDLEMLQDIKSVRYFLIILLHPNRSEERRVGKECRL